MHGAAMSERTEIIRHLRDELKFGKRMIERHRFDGHFAAAAQREMHVEKLTRWLQWLENQPV